MKIESEKILPPPVKPDIKLTLTLSPREASLLKTVMGNIAGIGAGARTLTDLIYATLDKLGVQTAAGVIAISMELTYEI